MIVRVGHDVGAPGAVSEPWVVIAGVCQGAGGCGYLPPIDVHGRLGERLWTTDDHLGWTVSTAYGIGDRRVRRSAGTRLIAVGARAFKA
jgi:hypothetical protein